MIFKKIIQSFLILLFLSTTFTKNVFADAPTFQAMVNTNKINLGSVLQLTLACKNGKPDQPPEIPEIPDVDVRYLGPSTSIAIVNGNYSQTIAYIYTLFPQKVGHFEIPAITTSLNGQTLTSQPIPFDVVDSGSAGGSDAVTSIKDKIFLTIETGKKEAFLHEKIPVTVKLFVQGIAVSDVQFPKLNEQGFRLDEFPRPSQYQQTIGGVPYNVIQFDSFIYPDQTGEIKLGPAQLVANILFQSNQRRKLPISGMDDFDDSFFDSFFNAYQKREITVSSADLTLSIRPLPDEGKPQDFSGAVGTFSFDTQVSPPEVSAGDPVSLKMKVLGNGSLQNVSFPTLPLDDNLFKKYDPEIKEEGGAKVQEQVVIPKSDRIQEIPAITFSYFDPEQQKYVSISKGPFPLKVKPGNYQEPITPPTTSQPTTSIPTPAVSSTPINPVLGQNIVYLKDHPGAFRPKNRFLYENPLLIGFVVLFWILGVGYLSYWRHQEMLSKNEHYVRRSQAAKKARKALLEAQQLMQEGRQKEFYDRIYKTLQDYLGDKMHLTSGAITRDVAEHRLRAHRINGEVVENIKFVFDECDLVRYGSFRVDQTKMLENYKRVEEAIDYLERNWK